MNQVAGEPKGDPFSPSPFTFPSVTHPPLYSVSRGVRGGREGSPGGGGGGEEKREMPTFFGQLRSQLNPLLPRRRPLQSPSARPAPRQRGASGRPALATPGAAAAGEP